MRPRVSVLLPVRNARDTLEACLESIRRQTLEDFEIIAVDDGSTDGSAAVLADWSTREPRLRPLGCTARGLVPALNFGLTRARAERVARMDADDLMHPERLERQCRLLDSDPSLALAASRVRLFPEEHIGDGYRHYIAWQNACVSRRQIADGIYVESPLAHPSVMFRREAVARVGGYRQGMFPEDYDLWLRLHHRGLGMAKLPEVLLYWRERPERTSRVDPRYSGEAFDRLRARYLAREPRLRARREDFVIWGAGRRTRARCAHLLERGFRPRAWVDVDPRKIGNRLAGIPVVPPEWLERKPRPFVLGYVRNHGARTLIADRLALMGYRSGLDYLMVG